MTTGFLFGATWLRITPRTSIKRSRGARVLIGLASLLGLSIIPNMGRLNTKYVRGSTRKNVIFQIASGPILSIPIYLKTCFYGPCKFSLKKNDQNLPAGHVKVLIFCRSSR